MSNTEIGNNLPVRIGLFGGTFNPVHKGHLQAADYVWRHFRLTRIYLIPSAQPPHKAAADLASAQDRFEMVRLATAPHPALNACDAEIKRSGTSYTIDTLRALKKKMPDRGELFFLLGTDAFLEIDSWKSFGMLFDESAFIVMERPGLFSNADLWRDKMADYIQNHICRAYQFRPDAQAFVHPLKKNICLAAVRPLDIASSRLRQQVRDGEAFDTWVPRSVADYIRKKGLYR